MAGRNTFSPGQTGSRGTLISDPLPEKSKVVVVGSGAFGGWSALHLLRKGYDVTLVDQWGPGNSRSSSGGETRLIRCIYGTNAFYTAMANRAYTLWQEFEKEHGQQFLFPTGCLWFVGEGQEEEMATAQKIMEGEGLEVEHISNEEVSSRYPLVNPEGLAYLILEKKTGYLMARNSCQAVVNQFMKEGGKFITGEARPVMASGTLTHMALSTGEKLYGDCYITACGPWLTKLFPEVMKGRVTVTRQEVFYFGVGPEQAAEVDAMPTWIDHAPPDFYYGIPGGIGRGFKIAFDRRGPEVDPDTQERLATNEEVLRAREYIGSRFNGLKNLPLVESRVCQYSDTADGNFIFDRHPEASNLWLLGGGSGHGFKHGPALGELVAGILSGTMASEDGLQLQ